MPHYQLFGLEVESDFALPHIPPGSASPQVGIRHGGVPEAVSDPTGGGAFFEAGAGEALIDIPPVGRFHVQGGRRISVEPVEGKSEDDLAPFILNLCLPLLLHQRGGVALHASVVEVGGRCVALAGKSGSGKSTLAAWLWTRGHRVLSDEICLLEAGADGRFHVRPGPPVFQLWRNVLKELDLEVEGLMPTRPGVDRHFVPALRGWDPTPMPLDAVYLLSPENVEGWRKTDVSGMDRFRGLGEALIRREYLEPMGLRERQFPLLASLAATVAVMRLHCGSRFAQPEEAERLLMGGDARIPVLHP